MRLSLLLTSLLTLGADASRLNDVSPVSLEGVKISSLKLTPVTDERKFIAQVEGTAQVRFVWRRSNGKGKTLYKDVHTAGRKTVALRRVAARTEFDVLAYVKLPSGAFHLVHTWNRQVCGRAIDDAASWATVTGTPTFDVLATDVAGDLIIFDDTGAVVATYTGCGGPRDQVDGNIVCLSTDGQNTGATLLEMDTDSNILTEASDLSPNHEARIDTFADDKPVLTFVTEYENDIKGQKVASWNRTDTTVTYPINLFDYFDPSIDWGALSSDNDWTHANSAGVGNSNNYIIAIRHLSAIASFDHDTLALQWVLSSEISSNFTFDSDYSRFYNTHDAQQLSNGNLIVFDNGDSRPDSEGGTYSRGAEYSLDFETMEATMVWEFKTGEYSQHAGAISKLDNGNYIVAASCDYSGASCNMLVYEADAAGASIANVTIPQEDNFGGYRTDVWPSLDGEMELEQDFGGMQTT